MYFHLYFNHYSDAIFVNDETAIKVNLSQTFEPMSGKHFLGTDDYGRDLFTRLVVGARSTLLVTVLTLIITVIIGVPLGLLAGYKKVGQTILLCVQSISD